MGQSLLTLFLASKSLRLFESEMSMRVILRSNGSRSAQAGMIPTRSFVRVMNHSLSAAPGFNRHPRNAPKMIIKGFEVVASDDRYRLNPKCRSEPVDVAPLDHSNPVAEIFHPMAPDYK